MSLEETTAGQKFNREGLDIAIEPKLAGLMDIYGCVSIDYKSSRWFGGSFHLKFANSGDSCC
jgi:hypothetical protein